MQNVSKTNAPKTNQSTYKNVAWFDVLDVNKKGKIDRVNVVAEGGDIKNLKKNTSADTVYTTVDYAETKSKNKKRGDFKINYRQNVSYQISANLKLPNPNSPEHYHTYSLKSAEVKIDPDDKGDPKSWNGPTGICLVVQLTGNEASRIKTDYKLGQSQTGYEEKDLNGDGSKESIWSISDGSVEIRFYPQTK